MAEKRKAKKVTFCSGCYTRMTNTQTCCEQCGQGWPALVMDKAFLDFVKPVLWATWNYIGGDLEQGCQEMGETLTNEVAIESCLDADRLSSCTHDKKSGQRVQAYLRAMYDKHGYEEVFKFLCKNVHYA